MFKALKDNKIIAISDTDSSFFCLVYDEILEDEEHTVADFTMAGSEYVLNDNEKAIEVKKEQVRAVRNQYLADTDKYMIVDFPISDEEREEYKSYRQYLRDYTKEENWWDKEPIIFEQWKQSVNEPVEETVDASVEG